MSAETKLAMALGGMFLAGVAMIAIGLGAPGKLAALGVGVAFVFASTIWLGNGPRK